MPYKVKPPKGSRTNGRPIGGKRAGAGRPTTYTLEKAERICLELRKGRSLISICLDEGMPERHTVVDWLEANPEFVPRYERARILQADFMDDRIIDVANASTSATSAADRVKIGAYQWRAGKLNARKYGDRVHKEVTGPDGGPVKFNVSGMTDDQLAAVEAALTGAADAAGGAASQGTGREGEEEG